MKHRTPGGRFGRGLLHCAVLVAGALMGACGAVPSDTYHQRVAYVSEDESFAMEFISPPWISVEETSSSLRLEIAAEIFGASIDDAPPTHVMIAGPVDGAAGFDSILDELGFGDALGDIPDIPDIPDISDLPDIPDLPGDLPGGDEELPTYLLDVDLTNHRDVAFAELRFLTEELGALVVNGLTTFTTSAGERGVVYQVGIEPGVFVRSFYFDRGNDAALRVGVASLFQLATTDIDLMLKTVRSDLVLSQESQ